MIIIYKYPLLITPIQEIETYEGIIPLHLELQNGIPCLWAVVNTGRPKVKAMVSVVATGEDITDAVGRYFGTLQMDKFVWHFLLQMPDDEEYLDFRGAN